MGCRRIGAQRTLVRLAATDDGATVGRTLPGRGAWVCPGAACVRVAIDRGTLARSLGVRREGLIGDVGDRLVEACVTASIDASPPELPQM